MNPGIVVPDRYIEAGDVTMLNFTVYKNVRHAIIAMGNTCETLHYNHHVLKKSPLETYGRRLN